jgi:hypothetical protein
MDELDRMYRRLVQSIRASFPDLLARTFEVAMIYQQIIPYRLNRRELDLESNDDYEFTLLRLVSGERGLLLGDEEMQRALRGQLESANPDPSAFRAFATATVGLSPEALRSLDVQPLVRPPGGVVSPLRDASTLDIALSGRATEQVPVPATPVRTTAPAAPEERSAPPAPAATATRPTPTGCQYCGGVLPAGRDVKYCPHCGHDLTIRQCPACGTELELDWRFCVTCGRQLE